MHQIAGSLHNYAWGVVGGLRPWISGVTSEADADQPQAELWYGAHPNGPSPLLPDSSRTLADQVDPNRVPLLVKLLAAARPLSIQVHPPAAQAAVEYAAQLNDPALPKLLSDSLAKTEMIIAVKPFSALQGLRDYELSAAILAQLGESTVAAVERLRAADVIGAMRALLAIPAADLGPLGERLPAAAAGGGLDPDGVRALSQVVAHYPADPGVLVATLLDHRVLVPGEGVFLPAGVPHAYVTGTGVEVMTASDNVLRLGLTPKTVAVDPALRAIQLGSTPTWLDPEPLRLSDGGVLRCYEPATAPFKVAWLRRGKHEFAQPGYRLVLAEAGEAMVAGKGDQVRLAPGEAVAVLDDEGPIQVSTVGSAFIAMAKPVSTDRAVL